MWQLYALSSLVAGALQNVADKAALVRDGHIDTVVATFWRNVLFWFFTVAVGYLGFFGELRIYFDWWIVLLGALAALSGYFYTYVLKRIEITGAVIETYLSPLAFLAIDLFVIHAPLTAAQAIGVIVLSIGGFAFALNAKTHKLKREYSPLIWGIFGFWLVFDGVSYYLFKFLNTTQGVNEVTFYANGWFYAIIFILAHIALTGRLHRVTGVAARKYIPAVTLSKLFDAAAALLWLRAISLTSVSQATAILALEPILLFVAAVFIQKETRFNIRERIDRRNISWKFAAASLLCLGIFLVT